METIVLAATTLFLMVLLVIQQVLNIKEKKDLLNRIMSRDFTDYSSNSAYLNSKPQKVTAVEDAVDKLLRQEAEQYMSVGS
jgi:hypothetical protein